MKNLIKNILIEAVSEKEIGSDFQEFYDLFEKKYGSTTNYKDILNQIILDIKKSPTPKITLTTRGQFCGMSLNDNVILNESIFNNTLHHFIFILFHEIAHQYQYKKYGKNLLYHLTTGELNDATLDKLIEIEQVADRFGESIANKYSTMFDIPKSKINKPYSNVEMGKSSYRRLIGKIQDEIKSGNISCVEQMENFMMEYLIPAQSTYTYTGSSYSDYGRYDGYGSRYGDYGSRYGGYGSRYSSYDDYEDYEDQYKKDDLFDTVKYTDYLEDLKNSIRYEIDDIVTTAYDTYGSTGLNVVIDMINDEGLIDFHYNFKEETYEKEEDNYDLMSEIFEDFEPVIEEMKKLIKYSLDEFIDEVKVEYGKDSVEELHKLMEKEGFRYYSL
jgi:hypothetical protein